MQNNKIKVNFIIPSLKAGGAERVLSYLAQKLDKKTFKSTLVVIGYEKDKVYDIQEVDVIFLNKKRVLHASIPLFKLLIKNKPDIVFTAIAHLNIMMGLHSLFFPKIKFVGREVTVHSVKVAHGEFQKKSSVFNRLTSKIGYRLLDKIVCQSSDMAKDLKMRHNFPDSKLVIINNPIPEIISAKTDIPAKVDNKFKLITVGRLIKLKGHQRILQVLSKLDHPYIYTIIGNGPEKENILSYSEELGILDRIIQIDFTNKVFDHLLESHFFIQGSFVEGFPNALLESCASGTPGIAFDAPGGTTEIIEEGINGFLVKTVEEFTAKLNNALDLMDNWDPAVVSMSVYKKYSSDKIMYKYEKLFVELVQS